MASRTATVWRLLDVLREASEYLERQSVEQPRLNAERLLAHVLGHSRVDLYLRFEQPIQADKLLAYKELLHRRAGREPLQYIIGETEFMSLPLNVDSRVLIPRPETEILTESVITDWKGRSPCILDIGTGSGCIAVSLAHYLPGSRALAIDADEDALSVARLNVDRHGLSERVILKRADGTEDIFLRSVRPPLDVVVCNPPYVSSESWEDLAPEIREFEPRKALCDEGDGLTFYRMLARGLSLIPVPEFMFYLEMGDGQADAVRTLFGTECVADLQVIEDLNRIPRVLKGKKKPV
ncbi:MAG TPA: peptide chain release factor N(5)-glutamine methyltransferase [bacterium]|nr:peptide chain release factor N(5)-glutamine methyltransferase [bacterium]